MEYKIYIFVPLWFICRDDEIGKRTRLKIVRLLGLRVQVPLPAQFECNENLTGEKSLGDFSPELEEVVRVF